MHCELQTNQSVQNSEPSETHRMVVTPPADVVEGTNNIVLTLDLPGVALADVAISLEKDLLSIEGAPASANDDGYTLTYAEYAPYHFHRVFRVESHVERDKITASMQSGVLKVTLPKAAPAKIAKVQVAVS